VLLVERGVSGVGEKLGAVGYVGGGCWRDNSDVVSTEEEGEESERSC